MEKSKIKYNKSNIKKKRQNLKILLRSSRNFAQEKINEVLPLRIARYAMKNLILLIIDTLLIMFYINKPYLEALENPRI